MFSTLSQKGILTTVMKTKIGFISGNGENPLNTVPYFEGESQAKKGLRYDTFMAPKTVKIYL